MALTNKLEAIGDAIRDKTGGSEKLTLDEMVTEIGSISGGVSEEEIVYEQMNDHVKAYLADTSSYTDSNYNSLSVAPNYKNTSQTTWERPNDTVLNVPKNGSLYFLNEDTNNGWKDNATQGSYYFRNLIPEHWYTCVLRDTAGKIASLKRIKGQGWLRMLFIPGSGHNFRDIGGWNADGGTIRYGKIHRGGQLDTYNTNDKKVYPLVNSLGISYLRDMCRIRVDIDLRSNEQVTGITSSLLGDDVEWYHTPYSDVDYVAIVNHNGSFVQQTRNLFMYIFENVNKGFPIYIHCQAGADRTGTILFVLEALLGVSPTDCDRDYEITTLYYGGMVARYRTSSSWVALRNYFNSLEGETLQDKAVTWCMLMGIPVDMVNKFRRTMIDGTPSDVHYNVWNIIYSLNNVTSSNSVAFAEQGVGYATTLTPNASYEMGEVKVTMGGIDITQSVYNSSTRVISIASTTGDVVITATAKAALVNVLPKAIASDGSSYNGGQGYKVNTRLNSGGEERSYTGATCTGFIPFKTGQTMEVHDIKLPANASTGGVYTENAIHFYDKNFNRIALPAGGYRCQSVFSTTYANPKSTTDDGFIATMSMSIANIEYVRFSTPISFGNNPIVYVY